MKKTLCFYFQIHQPVRLRRYRFFDIGKRHDYFDEYVNRSTIRRVAERCYFWFGIGTICSSCPGGD